ncbi:Ribosomal protein L13e [Babesia duncani]|uniref:Ribosomal protein L13e n=1 Tax=Babesia duncani TaxID=323732 RepID=A0AAD9UPK9_9APIC|nr:Ribosomal protein L13e [Babesia duncani]
MVKHNNVLPNAHRVKCKGKYIKAELNQAGRKRRRRTTREKKAKAAGVRPVGYLRPLVRMMSQRYNYKLRLGRGFTIQELKAAGISKKVAMSIGIAVDHRRYNKCAESLDLNVKRLKTWLSKLVMIPRKGNAKKGFAGIPDDVPKDRLKEMVLTQQKIKTVMPVVQDAVEEKPRKVGAKEQAENVYQKIRLARKALKKKQKAAE